MQLDISMTKGFLRTSRKSQSNYDY